jgi:hypothetical protein
MNSWSGARTMAAKVDHGRHSLRPCLDAGHRADLNTAIRQAAPYFRRALEAPKAKPQRPGAD